MARERKKELQVSKKDFSLAISIFFTALNTAAVLFLTFREFKYPTVSSLPRVLILGALILLPLVFSLAIRYFWGRLGTGLKLLSVFAVFIFLFGSLTSSVLFVYASPIESLTTKTDNYLDNEAVNYGYIEKILGVFPETIPAKAENAEYYYHYSDCVNTNVDIYAQWRLREDDYKKEKELILSSFPDAAIQDTESFSRVYITDDFSISSYEYLVFLHNDETNTVGYAYSFTDNTENVPYFRNAGR